MWFLRRKKIIRSLQPSGPMCSICGSSNTKLIVYHGTDRPIFVRVWKGQRVLTYRCFDCGQDFYAEEAKDGISTEILDENRLIDDEEALRNAEAEIKKQIDENDDRRCF